MCTITYTSKLIRRRSTLKGKPIWCCAAVKSNVHSRTNAQNVSYFQLMWKLAPFFGKNKIIRNIKLIFKLKINFQNQILEIFYPTYSSHCRLQVKSKIFGKNLCSVGCVSLCPKSEIINVLNKSNHHIFLSF